MVMDALLAKSREIYDRAYAEHQPFATVAMISGGNDSAAAFHAAQAVGVNSSGSVGERGCLVLARWVKEEKRYRVSVGYEGENIKADTMYRLDDAGAFIEVEQ